MKNPKRRSVAKEVGVGRGRGSGFSKKMMRMDRTMSRIVRRALPKSNKIHKTMFLLRNSRARLRAWQLICANAFWISSEGPKKKRDSCLLLDNEKRCRNSRGESRRIIGIM
jgi:hypothetical protein